MLVVRFDVDEDDDDDVDDGDGDADDVGNIISESSFAADKAIFWSVDVISVVIKRQSLRSAEAMQNKMLTNHVVMIKIHDFRTDTLEWYRSGSVIAHQVSPTTSSTERPPETLTKREKNKLTNLDMDLDLLDGVDQRSTATYKFLVSSF